MKVAGQGRTLTPVRSRISSVSSDFLRGPKRSFLRLRGTLGQHVSVRWKLTLWYGLMCAVTLGLTGIAMRAALDIQTSSLIDSSLRDTASSMLPSLARTPAEYTIQPVIPHDV